MSTENTNNRAKVIIPGYIESNDGGYVADSKNVSHDGKSLEVTLTNIGNNLTNTTSMATDLYNKYNHTTRIRRFENDNNPSTNW